MSVQFDVAHGLADTDTDRSARNFSALAAELPAGLRLAVCATPGGIDWGAEAQPSNPREVVASLDRYSISAAASLTTEILCAL